MFKFKSILSAAVLAVLCSQGSVEATDANKYGVVNFRRCIEETKTGQKEEQSFNQMKTELTAMAEGREKEIQEIMAKLQDSDFIDSISPEEEQKLKQEFAMKNQEMRMFENQFYQTMNQANFQLLHKIRQEAQSASAKVGEKEGVLLIVDEETCFFAHPALNLTDSIIAQMNDDFVDDTVTSDATETTEAAPVS